jgi:hypothetical protein
MPDSNGTDHTMIEAVHTKTDRSGPLTRRVTMRPFRVLLRYLLPVGLLLVMLAQLLAASPRQSAAFDEGYALTFGYGYLRGGDARLSRGQNPPLANLFLALPLLLRDDVVFPADRPAWTDGDIFGFTDELLWQSNVTRAAQLIALARLPQMALALLLACLIFAFTRWLFDERAAVAALFLCAFDPNLLAHGHSAGSDIGVTLFMFGSVWAWSAALKRSSLKRAVVAGLLAGAAFATKYSGVWLAPILALITVLQPGLRSHFVRRLVMALIAGVAALVVIWGTFQFSVGPIHPDGPWLPAPQYWQSIEGVSTRVELSTPAFMLGHVSAAGFLLYYPFVFLVKTPLPTLILLVLGALVLIRRHRRADMGTWLPPLLFLLVAMLGGLNLGYRLMLPVLPFTLVIAGQGMSRLLTQRARPPVWRAGTAAILGLWLAIDVLSINPEHLAYFNQLINRERDYDVLVDSNLDWGQDLIALRDWQRSHQIDRLNLAYYGSARPAAYDLDVQLLPGFSLNDYGPEIDGFSAYALPPGWYAISVSSLQLGLLYSHWNLYAPFKERQPVARVGRSFLIYHLTYPADQIDRTVILGPDAGSIEAAALGVQPDRQLIVKWAGEDTLVLDMQGAARYITRGGEPLAGFAPRLREALLAQGASPVHDASDQLRLWTIDARLALSRTLAALPAGSVRAPDGRPLGLPLAFDGGLTLLGYETAAGDDLSITTYWRVDAPLTPGLSLFVHGLDTAGQRVTQGDGLPVRLSTLEAGDVIVRRSRLASAAAVTAIDIGLYRPADGQRLPAAGGFDRVQLPLEP